MPSHPNEKSALTIIRMVMIMDTDKEGKKREEMEFAKLFLDIFGIKTELIPCENPDFIYNHEGLCVALELTRFYPHKTDRNGREISSDKQERHRVIWWRIKMELDNRGKEILSDARLYIWIDQDFEDIPKNKTDIKGICDEIIEFINAHIDGRAVFTKKDFGEYNYLRKFVKKIRINRSSIIAPHVFSISLYSRAGTIGLRPSELIPIIQKKADRANKMNGNFGKKVLLIYDHSRLEAGVLEFSKNILKGKRTI